MMTNRTRCPTVAFLRLPAVCFIFDDDVSAAGVESSFTRWRRCLVGTCQPVGMAARQNRKNESPGSSESLVQVALVSAVRVGRRQFITSREVGKTPPAIHDKTLLPRCTSRFLDNNSSHLHHMCRSGSPTAGTRRQCHHDALPRLLPKSCELQRWKG